MPQTEQLTLASDVTSQVAPPVLMVRGKPVRLWLALAAVIIGYFMGTLDLTIVNIAIPAIQASLKANLAAVSWVLNAYNLVFAVLLITGGRLADQYGRKRLLMLGMSLFSLASLGCALAQPFGQLSGLPAIGWLIGFRALQASGAAGLAPVSLAIILAICPPEKRGAAIGFWGACATLANAVGPVLGGFLVQTVGWPWIFLVNLPLGLTGLLMIARFVPETCDPHASQRVDVAGILTLSAALFCLVMDVIEGNTWGWTSILTMSLFAAAMVSFLLFILIELKQPEPMIDFRLFAVRSFSGANSTMFLFGIASQGAYLIAVLYFTHAQGYTQIQTAYVLLPMAFGAFIVALLTARVSRRISPHPMGIAGLLLVAGSFGLLCLLSPHAAYLDIAWRELLLGTGTGLVFLSQPMIALSDIPRARLGVGSGVFNTFRQIGFVLGVAILVSVFTGHLQVFGAMRGHSLPLQAIDASRAAWICAAVFAIIGLFSACLTYAVRYPRSAHEQSSQETLAPQARFE
jgi:EmrB/QacA subfamily drug resistance transporter